MDLKELQAELSEMNRKIAEKGEAYEAAKKAESEAEAARKAQEKADKLAQQQELLDQARGHRSAAINAPSLPVREKYLNWAHEAEKAAAELIGSDEQKEEETHTEEIEEEQAESWNMNQIKKSLIASSVGFLSFVIFYFLSDTLEIKVLNYAFDKLTQVALGAFLLSLGVAFIFFAWKKYFPILMHYLNDEVNTVYFKRDFLAATPEGRLYFLVALFYCFVQLIITIVQRVISG